MLAQHRAHGDVDGAAGGVGGDDPPLEILHLLHRTVFEHEELVAVVALRAVLELVSDDAQVVETGILDRQRERGKSEVAELDLVIGKRGDHRGRALEAHRLEQVGLAVVLHRLRLLREQRRPVRRRHDPACADLHRLGTLGRPGGKKHGQGQEPPRCAHVSSRLVCPLICARRYHPLPYAAMAGGCFVLNHSSFVVAEADFLWRTAARKTSPAGWPPGGPPSWPRPPTPPRRAAWRQCRSRRLPTAPASPPARFTATSPPRPSLWRRWWRRSASARSPRSSARQRRPPVRSPRWQRRSRPLRRARSPDRGPPSR